MTLTGSFVDNKINFYFNDFEVLTVDACIFIVYILLQGKLGEKYGVRGIPTLIVLDKDGNIKDAEARGTAQNCPGDKLPDKWC